MPPRRTRKRKRRRVSLQSSSSSSSSSDGDGGLVRATAANNNVAFTTLEATTNDPSSSLDSSSDEAERPSQLEIASTHAPIAESSPSSSPSPQVQQAAPSPSPPPSAVKTTIPTDITTEEQRVKDSGLREKFKKFWMASVADAFQKDLDQLRKEPHMTADRLSLLIDSLASGSDVFTNPSTLAPGQAAEEMELILSPATR